MENFEFMIFPDSNHGMNYHNGFNVVYDRILDFSKEHLIGNLYNVKVYIYIYNVLLESVY